MALTFAARLNRGASVSLAALAGLSGCVGTVEDLRGSGAGSTTGGLGGNASGVVSASGGAPGAGGRSTATGGIGSGGLGSGGANTGGANAGGSGTGGIGGPGTPATGGRGQAGAPGTGGATSPDGGMTTDGGTAAVTWTEIYTNYFNNTAYVSNCAGAPCHNPGTAHEVNLVTKALGYTSIRALVTPGSPNAGSLMRVLNSGAMPEGRPKMSVADLAKVQAWISAGALNN